MTVLPLPRVTWGGRVGVAGQVEVRGKLTRTWTGAKRSVKLIDGFVATWEPRGARSLHEGG
jgi:hypothetical protein